MKLQIWQVLVLCSLLFAPVLAEPEPSVVCCRSIIQNIPLSSADTLMCENVTASDCRNILKDGSLESAFTLFPLIMLGAALILLIVMVSLTLWKKLCRPDN